MIHIYLDRYVLNSTTYNDNTHIHKNYIDRSRKCSEVNNFRKGIITCEGTHASTRESTTCVGGSRQVAYRSRCR